MVEGAEIGPTSKQVRLQEFPFLFFFGGLRGGEGGGRTEEYFKMNTSSGIMPNGYFPPSPCWKQGGIFL